MDRFWSKVDIRTKCECWEWKANRHKQGYGFFKLNDRNQLAHRVSYFLTWGEELPSDVKLLHSCDNPPCVNPNHLFKGSQADNCRDMAKKQRHRGSRILTPEQVLEIRKDKRTSKSISKDYGVSESTIYYARTGLNWKHI